MEAFLHTTFIPSCEDIEKYAPAQSEELAMYQPFPQLEEPKDRPTPEQLERMETLLRKIKMSPAKVAEIMPQAKKEPKGERQELQEVQSKGMKAKVIDRKAEAANDK
jgi:hypothetical protein